MELQTGTFDDYREHHEGWFKFYRFRKGGYELWLGNRWISIEWGSKSSS